MPTIYHKGITANLRKRGRYYMADWLDADGGRHRRSTGCDTLEDARDATARFIEQDAQGSAAREAVPRLSGLLELMWIDGWRKRASGPQMKRQIEEVIEIIGDIRSDEMTDIHISRLKDHYESTMGLKPGTIDRRFVTLNSVLNTAQRKRWNGGAWYPPMPTKEAEEKGRPRSLSDQEIAALLDATTTLEWREVFSFMLSMGARRGEMVTLCEHGWDDIDLANKRVTLFGKGSRKLKVKKRTLPLPDSQVAMLRRRKLKSPKRPWNVTIGRLRGEWERVEKRIGLEDDPHFVPHVLRHTTATRMVNRGIPLAKVMQFLGHRSIKTTLIYVDLDEEDLRDGAESVAIDPSLVGIECASDVPESDTTRHTKGGRG